MTFTPLISKVTDSRSAGLTLRNGDLKPGSTEYEKKVAAQRGKPKILRMVVLLGSGGKLRQAIYHPQLYRERRVCGSSPNLERSAAPGGETRGLPRPQERRRTWRGNNMAGLAGSTSIGSNAGCVTKSMSCV